MNKVILIGRLTRDPDIRYTQGQNPMAIARYTLAVDRQRRANAQDGQPTADFISCVAFGKSAEFAEKYLHKGSKLAVEGRIQTGSYVGNDGNKVYTTDVVIERSEFVESKRAADNGGDAADNAHPDQGYANDGFMNTPDGIDDFYDDGGLPFN